jgi:hypothetical protein
MQRVACSCLFMDAMQFALVLVLLYFDVLHTRY